MHDAVCRASVDEALAGRVGRRKVGPDERLHDAVAPVAHHGALVWVDHLVDVAGPLVPPVVPADVGAGIKIAGTQQDVERCRLSKAAATWS